METELLAPEAPREVGGPPPPREDVGDVPDGGVARKVA
jgi:hypothetical protein